jgi:hypothetical protein
MHRIALVLSLLFLAACTTETEGLLLTPLPAKPQPTAEGLQGGLAVSYYYGRHCHINFAAENLGGKDL